jgi:hypothetical protein
MCKFFIKRVLTKKFEINKFNQDSSTKDANIHLNVCRLDQKSSRSRIVRRQRAADERRNSVKMTSSNEAK